VVLQKRWDRVYDVECLRSGLMPCFFVVAGLTAVGLFVARSWSDEEFEIEGKEV